MGIVCSHNCFATFPNLFPSIREENKNVPASFRKCGDQSLTAKKLTDRYKSVAEMYVDLSSCLSYERRNEKKLVFTEDQAKADTKTLPKWSNSKHSSRSNLRCAVKSVQ